MNRISILLPFLMFALPGSASAQTSIDTIVATVDEDIITRREMEQKIKLVEMEFLESSRSLPDPETLYRQVLEVMINESVQVQQARKRGINIPDSQLNQAMQKIAQDNNLSLSDFRQTLISRGLDYNKYRESLRKELALRTLRGQYTAQTASVSETEIDDFMRRSEGDLADFEYQISHILIALPDAATPEQVSKALETANQVLARLDQGEAFAQMANQYSTASTALQGGDLGWRKKAEIPSLFTDTVIGLEPGRYAGPLRSASGFHLVYLAGRRDSEQVFTEQVRSRHILIKPNELISDEEAKKRLNELRSRIQNGEDFSNLARLHSVDYASGAAGGDIGWMNPGATVKEYETVVNKLESGQISEPFQSQFGWHIVEVTGKRTLDETAESKRDKIHSQLIRQKQREVFDVWQRRLRDEATVILSDG